MRNTTFSRFSGPSTQVGRMMQALETRRLSKLRQPQMADGNCNAKTIKALTERRLNHNPLAQLKKA